MKNLILIIGTILIATNILAGWLLSCYSSFNMWFATVVILITSALLYCVHISHIKDAFKVSLTILLPIMGLIKLLLGVFSPNHIQDNWCVIVCIIISLLEILILVIIDKTSKSV